MAALIPNRSSLNGYFDFDQEYRIYNGTPQTKNTNRSLSMRVNGGHIKLGIMEMVIGFIPVNLIRKKDFYYGK